MLTEDVPTDDDGSYDLKRLGEINDFIVPMVYDEHYQSGTPGPVASEAWFQNQIGDAAEAVAAGQDRDRSGQLRVRLDHRIAQRRRGGQLRRRDRGGGGQQGLDAFGTRTRGNPVLRFTEPARTSTRSGSWMRSPR